MGGCFSIGISNTSYNDGDLQRSLHSYPTAKVISVNGALREYPVPVVVSQVLQAEQAASSSSSSSSSFICHSDRLYYDDYIPVLDSEDELDANQIYFLLPRSKLERRLSATDMAALAVRASLALQNASTSSSTNLTKGNRKGKGKDPHHPRNYKKSRISPVFINYASSEDRAAVDGDSFNEITIGASAYKALKQPAGTAGLGISRSGSVRKLQRYTSRKAKMAARSFRLRLTTIHEGSVL